MTFRFTSAALRELKESSLNYEDRQCGLGGRFLAEVDAAIERIRSSPEAWRRMSPRTRRCLLHRFPFGVLHQIRGEQILALSVMDLRRDPDSWKKHL